MGVSSLCIHVHLYRQNELTRILRRIPIEKVYWSWLWCARGPRFVFQDHISCFSVLERWWGGGEWPKHTGTDPYLHTFKLKRNVFFSKIPMQCLAVGLLLECFCKVLVRSTSTGRVHLWSWRPQARRTSPRCLRTSRHPVDAGGTKKRNKRTIPSP